ncbi:hypothetical protein BJ878DRAFT_579544 [Calycina marina]|uniref:Cip1-like core domain-containing protein n=1 Tax=Calycina marina TaxID=1763456 RepID=A0A9P7ZC92_9HELO|nr:hypothetical protein BJ878DRAFT_579544 [Calycina marina]
MLRQISFLPIALTLSSVAQVSEGFENGWDQAAWPNSIRVDGAGGYCGHDFVGTIKVPSSGDVYVRTYLKVTKALTASHVPFITIPDSAQGTNKHLRIGNQSSILMYNRESNDAALPDLSPQGIATSATLTVNEWQCFEYHLSTDGTVETWLNNSTVAGLTVVGGVTNLNDAQRSRSTIVTGLITAVYFGWESYDSDVNTFWFDHIVIASTCIGS